MSAVPHPHHLVNTSVTLVITIMYLNQWQGNMLQARLLQGHNLIAPLQVFLKSPRRRSTDDQRETARQQPQTEPQQELSAGQDGQRRFSVPELPEKQAEERTC